MDESIATQNRRSRRSNVLLTAALETEGEMLPVKLRNLSSEGALVEARQLPAAGKSIVFHRKELSVSGRVAWVNGSHAGVAFDRRLPADLVLRHVPSPRPRVKPDFRRPGLACREMSAEERRLVESWVWNPGPSRPGE